MLRNSSVPRFASARATPFNARLGVASAAHWAAAIAFSTCFSCSSALDTRLGSTPSAITNKPDSAPARARKSVDATGVQARPSTSISKQAASEGSALEPPPKLEVQRYSLGGLPLEATVLTEPLGDACGGAGSWYAPEVILLHAGQPLGVFAGVRGALTLSPDGTKPHRFSAQLSSAA